MITEPTRSSLSDRSRRLAGILLIVLPAVVFGGTSLLTAIINDPAYTDNALRQDLWRAGHAHAGVLLVLALVMLRYLDEASLPPRTKTLVAHAAPVAAILLPLAFFLSVLSPEATEPNAIINVAYVGAVILAAGTIGLGVGLLRQPNGDPEGPAKAVAGRR